jgi:tRNA nucleotidyltransferase/poly(A) polymerase
VEYDVTFSEGGRVVFRHTTTSPTPGKAESNAWAHFADKNGHGGAIALFRHKNHGRYDVKVRPMERPQVPKLQPRPRQLNLFSWVTRECKFAAQSAAIKPTSHEQQVFGFLLEVQKAMGLPGSFRLAGGWVRDKLLGKESDDMDVALDGMTGANFEAAIAEYAKRYEETTGGPHPAVGKSYTVRANPDKSKHLETVAIEIYGQKVDFVNLRSETYGDTRVPEMRMGTPKDDALRRDLTINSLFYNVNTGQVEDHTGMGLDDLRTMTLRTPMDPKRTFMDDPLRILRVLRFYSRYQGASIAPGIREAMSDPEVQASYRGKVAPERAGPEITKMMGGDRPAEALRVMFDSGMDKAVFDVPETQALGDLRMDQRNKAHAHNLLEHTLRVVENMNQLSRQEGLDDDTRLKMNMAALFHDYGKAHPEIGKPKASDPTQYSYLGHEDKSAEISDSILRRIGVGKPERDFVNKVVSMHMRVHTDQWSKRTMGKFMRDLDIPGQSNPNLWKLVMLHGMADSMSKGTDDVQEEVDLKRGHIGQFEQFVNTPPPAKPLIGGTEMMAMFPGINPATKFIGFLKQRLLSEQDSGTITTPEQAKAFVEGLRPEVESQFGRNKLAWVRANCLFAKKKEYKEYLVADERAEVRRRFGDTQCSFAKDDDGYYCYTHRARSDSYESISDIPQKDVDFIGSTS